MGGSIEIFSIFLCNLQRRWEGRKYWDPLYVVSAGDCDARHLERNI
jgi:hypothetical protein